MILVTSFSRRGYDQYGKKMLESAVFNFPGRILVYYEELPDLVHEKIEYRPLLEVYGCKNFLDYCSRKDIFSGKTPFGYDYNHDAMKFSKKVFAQFDAFKEGGKVFWFDADSVIEKPLTEDFLNSLFDGEAVVFPGRFGFHTETGFLGFDTEHKDFPTFLEAYKKVYQKGLIFTLPKWHDCEAFDWARMESGVHGLNLSPDWHVGMPLDVIPTTAIGEYLTHYKGNKKWKQKDSAQNSLQ